MPPPWNGKATAILLAAPQQRMHLPKIIPRLPDAGFRIAVAGEDQNAAVGRVWDQGVDMENRTFRERIDALPIPRQSAADNGNILMAAGIVAIEHPIGKTVDAGEVAEAQGGAHTFREAVLPHNKA